QKIGDAVGHHRSVGEKSDQETLGFRVRVNVQKIRTRKNLAASKKDPETTGLRDLIKQAFVFIERELAIPGRLVRHGKIVVAVLAFERAAVRKLDRDFHRHALAQLAFMHAQTECSIGSFDHSQVPGRLNRKKLLTYAGSTRPSSDKSFRNDWASCSACSADIPSWVWRWGINPAGW